MTLSRRSLVLLPTVLIATPALHASIGFTITHEHCSNGLGVVVTVVTGGVPPYTYAWSNSATTQNLVNVPAGSYTLTVTDFLGAQQVNTAVVQNLPSWEWDPNTMFAAAIPSCLPGPEPNQMGFVFFGGAAGTDFDVPAGPAPHQFDRSCGDAPYSGGTLPSDWVWGELGSSAAMCHFALPGEIYSVNYTDANGCPGYMEALVPQVPQFYPVTILDVEGSCSGGANGSVQFSIPPEPAYIYGARPHLYNPDGQENLTFWNSMATNWTDGWNYNVPALSPGTYAIVRRLTIDPDMNFSAIFPCGDTAYFTIPDLGPTCGNVSGVVAIDVDEDCVLDPSDAEIPEMILEFTPGPFHATTNQQGEYSINLPLGNYSVEQQTTVLDEHCSGNPSPLTVLGNMTFNLLDTATQSLDIQLSMASGAARPGFELQYAIDLDNLTSGSSNPNAVLMTFDPAVSFISAVPTPSSVVGNTITWTNAGALYYFQHRDITVRLQVPPDVGLIGTDLEATATVTPGPADVNTANNTATVVTTVTGSYDPNDKTATTSSNLSREHYVIDEDEWIDYTIRFQNTGTDTAFTVVITDTLPATLDASSLIVGAGSHPFTWNLQGSGTLRCYFVNILLPDSNANEPASHGFVSFRIKPHLPIVAGTVIENVANIFFDYNPPVITEPSVLVAEFSTGMQEQAQGQGQVRLLPNPVNEILWIASDGTIERIVILSADGRVVKRWNLRASNGSIDVKDLTSGAYLLTAELSNGTIARERFIKH